MEFHHTLGEWLGTSDNTVPGFTVSALTAISHLETHLTASLVFAAASGPLEPKV